MRTSHLQAALYTVLLFLCSGCMKDTWTNEEFTFDSEGLYIINSGNFGSSTSSLSYYDTEHKVVYNNVISRSNAVEYWGDVAQSMVIKDHIGYIVVNNSGKVLLIDTDTGQLIGKITDLESPRYMHFVNHKKAYITDLYARAISIVDPSSIATTLEQSTEEQSVHLGKISTNNNKAFSQHATEKITQWGHLIFVACWMRDDKVLVIDSNADEVIDSITVAAQPNSLLIDKYNKLWVLCDGGYEGNPYAHESPKLYRINTATLNIEDSISFALEDNPQELHINASKDTLFFLNTHLYRVPVTTTKAELHIESNSQYSGYGRGFYGLSIDPRNSEIYISDAIDNSQPGYVYRFSASGSSIDTFKVGVNPVSFCFK